MELKYTLIADGSSDRTLLKIIKWSLDNLYPTLANEGSFADFRSLKNPPKTLKQKVDAAKTFYPSDIVFIHRDGETTNSKIVEKRRLEVLNELGEFEFRRVICVVPIKMMESWLLIDNEAIKKAAGNRSFSGEMNLPLLKNIEKENQPKLLLHTLLTTASGLKGRGLKKFNPDRAVHFVAEYIDDFSLLRRLVAFQAFEEILKMVINEFLESAENRIIVQNRAE